MAVGAVLIFLYQASERQNLFRKERRRKPDRLDEDTLDHIARGMSRGSAKPANQYDAKMAGIRKQQATPPARGE